jgi:2,5-diamino-6-(ribosylamino)-4(3H)-pyrimidinone 5'-phosphate reductase
MDRPITTLFLIESVDGKISTGDTDELDVDSDFKDIVGVHEGLFQYYDLEKKTDLVSVNSGSVQAKIGVNQKDLDSVKKTDVSFVMIDSKPHLTSTGTEYFAKKSRILYLITTNKNHPGFELSKTYPNIHMLLYKDEIDFVDVFTKLKMIYGIERMTIQTGGTLNAEFVRLGLIDYLSLVVAPCLIGGSHTQSLIGGESLHSPADLIHVKALELLDAQQLHHSYVHLRYKVIHPTTLIK